MARRAVLAIASLVVTALFLMLGGIAVLLTLIGTVVIAVAAPILWFTKRRAAAYRMLAGWGAYLAFYVLISTMMSLFKLRAEPEPHSIGQQVCADAGCFTADAVKQVSIGPDKLITIPWRLVNNDKQAERRFPGKGLEVYLFDERERKFALESATGLDPLDVTMPPGEAVRGTLTFRVPADARKLFLSAEYRAFTFQSLFPGVLSLLPRRHPPMIVIQ